MKQYHDSKKQYHGSKNKYIHKSIASPLTLYHVPIASLFLSLSH